MTWHKTHVHEGRSYYERPLFDQEGRLRRLCEDLRYCVWWVFNADR